MSHMRARVTLDVWLNLWVDTESAARHLVELQRRDLNLADVASHIDELQGISEILEIEEVRE